MKAILNVRLFQSAGAGGLCDWNPPSGSRPTLSPSAAAAGMCAARKRGWEQSEVKAGLTFKTVCVHVCPVMSNSLSHYGL